MDMLASLVGELLCLAIFFSVQAGFVWLAAKFVRVGCTVKEAAIIAGICAVLLSVPKVGLLLSPIAFFFLFMRLLAADTLHTIYAFLANIFLNVVLVATV